MRQDYTNVQNIYIVCGKTDMRKGIDGLATLIQDSFELDLYSDSIFLFAGWKKDRYKCLYFDGNGFAMLYKRLTQQVQNLTKLLYGSKTEKSKYNEPDGQGSLFEDDSSFPDSEHTEEQSQQTISYSVVRKFQRKKRNDVLREDIETEVIHHHPEHTECACCSCQMTEIGGTIVREEALFIPAKMKKVQHMEHAYECTHCKNDVTLAAQIIRGKAPQPAIQRSIAGPSWPKPSTINSSNTCPFTDR